MHQPTKTICVHKNTPVPGIIFNAFIIIVFGVFLAYYSIFSRVFLCIIFPFLVIYYISSSFNNNYVAQLKVTPKNLIIVYRKGRTYTQKTIKKDDIESVVANCTLEQEFIYRCYDYSCSVEVVINLLSGQKVSFVDKCTAAFTCLYGLMFRLIDISRDLPNFKYNLEGNWEAAKEDINYYNIHRRRMSNIKTALITYKKGSIFLKICMLLGMVFWLYLVLAGGLIVVLKVFG